MKFSQQWPSNATLGRRTLPAPNSLIVAPALTSPWIYSTGSQGCFIQLKCSAGRTAGVPPADQSWALKFSLELRARDDFSTITLLQIYGHGHGSVGREGVWILIPVLPLADTSCNCRQVKVGSWNGNGTLTILAFISHSTEIIFGNLDGANFRKFVFLPFVAHALVVPDFFFF